MRLIQPYPNHESPIQVPSASQVSCAAPVRFVRYRCPHHAAPSGYDRICDYIQGSVINLSTGMYWLGETVLRPLAILNSKTCGKHCYSRHDFIMEIEMLRDFMQKKNKLYHFVYAEKSFHLTEKLAGKRGHRLVGTVHGPEESQLSWHRNLSHFRCFDHLITMDRKSIPFWQSITERDNVTWLPHGVDTDYFHPQKQRPEGPFRVVFCGQHERDLDSLEAVIRKVVARSLNVRFELVSATTTAKTLAHEIESVTQHAQLSDEAYRRLLQAADILFLPLFASTVCNAVLEALSCGTPVITTRGGIEDYIDECCARVTEVGDVLSMVKALAMEAGLEPGKRLSRQAARQKAETFSWHEVAKRHVDLFNHISASRSQTSQAAIMN